MVGRTLAGMDELDGLVDLLERASVEMTDQLLRRSGAVVPPTVHMISNRLPQPYIGSIATRPFHRGEDAASAIRMLGALPSVVRATQLLLVWEFTDMCAALQDPRAFDGSSPNGLVVVDARIASHVVRWHQCIFRMPGPRDDVASAIVPAWRPPARHPGGALPAPVTDLLEVWRTWHDGDVREVRSELETGGYVVSWAADRLEARRAAGR